MEKSTETTVVRGGACGIWWRSELWVFSSYAMEHVYMIGFVRQRLALPISNRGGTTCLRDQRHGGEIATMVLWELCEAM